MSMQYVRDLYGVPAKRGGRVMRLHGRSRRDYGTITMATNYVHVRMDGSRISVPFHPTDLAYYNDDGFQIWPTIDDEAK